MKYREIRKVSAGIKITKVEFFCLTIFFSKDFLKKHTLKDNIVNEMKLKRKLYRVSLSHRSKYIHY